MHQSKSVCEQVGDGEASGSGHTAAGVNGLTCYYREVSSLESIGPARFTAYSSCISSESGLGSSRLRSMSRTQ